MPNQIVTVGASQAAAVATRTLRRRGYDGRVVLVGDETHLPYERPPLSKELLAGERSAEDVTLLSEQWCADNDVELRLGVRAERVDTQSRAVVLEGGSRVEATAVLLATGCRPRRLPGVEGGERVVYLRTLDDALRLRAHLRPGARVVAVGAGFVGSEVASVARGAGAEVTVLETLDVPLERVLGRRMGEVCARIHREHGVDLRTGEAVESATETGSGVLVRTTGGAALEADVVVVGVGTVPNTEVAERSGIACDNGVLVDERCATDVEGVYAAGDVTSHFHPLVGRHVRVEHFDNASKQAMVAGKVMAGRKGRHAEPHWFWSDQYGLDLQYAGHAATWDEVVVRGSVDALGFCAFYLDAGVVRAAFSVGRGADMFLVRELVGAAAAPDPAKLRDEDVELADLLPA